jgi:hypothetical protein
MNKKDILEELKELWTQWDDDASWESASISGNIQYGMGMEKCADDLKELLIRLKVFNE